MKAAYSIIVMFSWFFNKKGFVSYIDGFILVVSFKFLCVAKVTNSSIESDRINEQIKVSFSPCFLLYKNVSESSSFRLNFRLRTVLFH